MCKKIHRGGNAEQYYADEKYKEAVAVAVAKCADDTKGQTCYICLEAVHPRTGEGLVRGCACGDRDDVASGRTGVAHVSCLAEQAKILVAEAKDNHLDHEARDERWARWHVCGLCGHQYHGVVKRALGWACWKTYVGRPEGDRDRLDAMTVLGNGSFNANYWEEALIVQEAELSALRRLGASEKSILTAQGNLASTYRMLRRYDQALRMRRDVYHGFVRIGCEEHRGTFKAADNLVTSLLLAHHFEEAKYVLHKTLPVARRVLGDDDDDTLELRWTYGRALYCDQGATLDDLREAVTTLEATARTARRVLGDSHPLTMGVGGSLKIARSFLFFRNIRLGLWAPWLLAFAVAFAAWTWLSPT